MTSEPTSSAHAAAPISPFEFDREVEERLLRYALIDTQSDEQSPSRRAPRSSSTW